MKRGKTKRSWNIVMNAMHERIQYSNSTSNTMNAFEHAQAFASSTLHRTTSKLGETHATRKGLARTSSENSDHALTAPEICVLIKPRRFRIDDTANLVALQITGVIDVTPNKLLPFEGPSN
jgi:hypothetical protein